ncbi:MAG TPA: NAD(P)-dependent oxidoreductase, partial [Burkholderiales bacterium]|nr:NAD(P)-dependent oxidoreductase [Burkholderiales bacterium]
ALLDGGHLAGATLDVFLEEPLPASHRFWMHAKVFVTPHCSALTVIDDSVAQVAGKIRALEQGRAITGVVDRARGY